MQVIQIFLKQKHQLEQKTLIYKYIKLYFALSLPVNSGLTG